MIGNDIKVVLLLAIGVSSHQVLRFQPSSTAQTGLINRFVRDNSQLAEIWDAAPGRHMDVFVHDDIRDVATTIAVDHEVLVPDVHALMLQASESESSGDSDFHSSYHSAKDYGSNITQMN